MKSKPDMERRSGGGNSERGGGGNPQQRRDSRPAQPAAGNDWFSQAMQQGKKK
jgi:hypothetical protein